MSGKLRTSGLFILTGDWTTVSEATPFQLGQLGEVFDLTATTPQTSGAIPKSLQYVKRYATTTAAAQAGGLAFWQDSTNFVVTSDPGNAEGGTTAPIVAGVFGGTNPQPGEYGFIQVGGETNLRVVDSTSLSGGGLAGQGLIWATNHQVSKQIGTYPTTFTSALIQQVIAIQRSPQTATTTNLTVAALLTIARLAW